MAQSTIHAVIWDLDGVIIDSADEHRRAWHRLAQEEEIPFTDIDFWATFGKRNNDIIPQFWGDISAQQVADLANRKEVHFREYIRDAATPLPGSMELMRDLQKAGYRQALASSTPVENIRLISEVLHLERYLSKLVSGESVARGKPAPDIFLKAAAELDALPTHSLVIEDAVAGILAARAAGMHCIAVAGDRDLPGLRAADRVVRDLTEVSVEQVNSLLKI
ncbi:MAG TPA: HAD family phosphatase [Ktedonobacteraceae bacterium]|nr:HAD family phosphatase [Ktedonobacteraceae bacterium]